MNEPALSDARRRIVDLVKRRGPSTAGELAKALELTEVAVRQHLQALETAGLARARRLPAQGRGRPSMSWSLTEQAAALFPDRHGELTVGLLDALRGAFGEKGLERVIEKRTRQQVELYRSRLPAARSLKAHVAALAEQRTAEGYMAEVLQERPGTYLLVEHHCPICDAARCCLRLCSSELEVFQQTLGPDVHVERTEHVLSGDLRCAYRIRRE